MARLLFGSGSGGGGGGGGGDKSSSRGSSSDRETSNGRAAPRSLPATFQATTVAEEEDYVSGAGEGGQRVLLHVQQDSLIILDALVRWCKLDPHLKASSFKFCS